MKHLVIVGDGMADEECPELGGKTPLQYARTPNMDMVASGGEIGLAHMVPTGYPPGSDVANLSVMGYDPRKYYTGRAPLEAVSMGIDLGDSDVAFRCNLVNLSDADAYEAREMIDYSAGEIGSTEARKLIESLNERLGSEQLKFYPGISYRHLLVWRGGPTGTRFTPPHDISGRVVKDYLPAGDGSDVLGAMMIKSNGVLTTHSVNRERRAHGLREANSIWFWGQGRRPALPPFRDRCRMEGAVISAVDLIKGIGLCAQMTSIEVEGATGTINTNFRGKARAALSALATGLDFVLVHVAAPDEASHHGDLAAKIRAIEAIDEQVLGETLYGLKEMGPFCVLILPDHPTPLRTRTHSTDPVPFAIMRSGRHERWSGLGFDEASAARSDLRFPLGHELLAHFMGGGR